MRRRRKSKTPANQLRNLALAGRWAEVRALLEARLAADPHDAEARAEWERLHQGLPLRATETALARKRREEQEMIEELAGELALYRNNPAMVEAWDKKLVAKRCRRLAHILHRLGKRLPAELAKPAAEYHTFLAGKVSTRNKYRRIGLLLGLVLPMVAAAAVGTALLLDKRAEQARDNLSQALQSQDAARIELALHEADSGLNTLFNSDLEELIDEAHTWATRSERLQISLREELAALETGKRNISKLPLTLRAAIEDKLRELPPAEQELRNRWNRLCEKNARTLAAQREAVVQRFRAPIPQLPQLSGIPAKDDAELKQLQKELQNTLHEWEAAHSVFQLDPSYGEKLRERLQDIRPLRADIAALRQTLSLLPTARDYAQYRSLLEQLAPSIYAPALRVAAAREHLPAEDAVHRQMQIHGHPLTLDMLDAACRAHLEGGASFTAAYPAHLRQLQLMEDIFSYTGLQKELYQLSAYERPSFITEERPEVDEERVRFKPSPLSPGYTLNTPRHITWNHPQGAAIRRINCAPLLQETGICRENFFTQSNLPTLLDTLLQIHPADCPALARAYVFHCLLQVMSEHEHPTMLGLPYAPSLRADTRDFNKLVAGLGIPLEVGCWLQKSEQVDQAEALCAKWFRKHKKHRYAQEIAHNFGALVRVHPRYVGYMDADGKAQLFHTPPAGTLLWYAAEDGLAATPCEKAPVKPRPYSPVFVTAKD